MKLKQTILAAAVVLAAAVPMQAQAATATAAMQVNMSVVAPTGSISFNGPMDFGTRLTTDFGAGQASTTMTVQVTNGIPYSIALDAGLTGINGTMFLVDVANSANRTAYRIYSDSTLATRWGDGVANLAGAQVSGTGSGNAVTLTLYGAEIISNLTMSAGTFSDTVTATLTY